MIIDLWLVYGHWKITKNRDKQFPTDIKICGGLCRGEIISTFEDRAIRIDCGIVIDVDNELDLNEDYGIGEFVEVSGTYQIYLPNTDYDR